MSCDELVLGVLDQSGYNRKEPKDESAGRDSRKARLVEENESFRQRGLKSDETLERSTADLPPDIKVITVCGRERDMADYKSDELFARAQSLRVPLLVRIVRNRMTMENKRILDEIRKERCQGRVEVTIPQDSRSGRRYCSCGMRHIR